VVTNLYGYAESLNPGKTVVSITLPDDPDVEILAMDLVSQSSSAAVTAAATVSGSGTAPSGNAVGTVSNATASIPTTAAVAMGVTTSTDQSTPQTGAESTPALVQTAGPRLSVMARPFFRGQRKPSSA
jgi:hypothetical protein